MLHEESLQQEELAQTHQLGELQKEYRVQIDKTLLLTGSGFLFGALFYLLEGGPRLLPLSLADELFLLVLLMLFPVIVLLRYRHVHVYLYTHGLLYLHGNTSMVARWEQIRKIFGFGGNTYVLVDDGSRIELSSFICGIGELRSTLKREIANHRSGS